MFSHIRAKLANPIKPSVAVIFYILLIFMSATSMMASDMYVPSLPAIMKYFGSTATYVKLTIPVYLVTFALSQLIYGPLSDRRGRRPIVLLGMSIFFVGSLVCAAAPSIVFLLLGRFIQGIGAGALISLTRAIVRDVFSGNRIVQASSYISLAFGIEPAVSPMIGGYLQDFAGWRMVFIFLLIYTVCSFIIVSLFLPETNKHKNIRATKIRYFLDNYKFLLLNKTFMSYVFIASVSFSGLIAYYTMSPFLLQTVLHLSPVAYGWITLAVASVILFSKLVNVILVRFLLFQWVLRLGTICMLLGGVVTLLLGLLGIHTLTSIVFPIMLYMLGLGMIASNAASGALLPFSKIAGVAAAFYGCVQILGLFFVSFIAAHLTETSQVPLAILLTTLAVLSALCAFLFIKPSREFITASEKGA